jgi:hypothetical protein
MPQREHQNIPDDSSPDSSGVITSFDELTKGLATGAVSRGKALRWMGGALVGAALAAIPGVAWADDYRCSEGQTRCGDRCVNLQTNERHCGSCGNRCRSTQTCCKGRCVNLQRNERHCGSCFNQCFEGSECVGGLCRCPSGTTLCGGACVSDSCPEGQAFNFSTCKCELACPSGTVACGGACVSNTCPEGQGFDLSTCQCGALQQFGCCVCTESTNPDLPPQQACLPGVTSQEECCDSCSSSPPAFRQCSFVTGPSSFTCESAIGPVGLVCRPT